MGNKADNRFPLRLDDLTRWKIEYWYKRANCDSRNAFVEKAVNFYADYLAGLENSVLPTAVQSAITAAWECSRTGCSSSSTS